MKLYTIKYTVAPYLYYSNSICFGLNIKLKKILEKQPYPFILALQYYVAEQECSSSRLIRKL